MRFFDLHCDTIDRIVNENGNILENEFHVSLNRAKKLEKYIGCFAIWANDSLTGKKAFEYFKKCSKIFIDQEKKYGKYFKICRSKKDFDDILENKKTGAILSVEGSHLLGGDILNVKYMSKIGVKIMSLTWNNSCESGDGVGVINFSRGLTNFGKKLLCELEKYSIVVDVSHAGEKLFYDVLKSSKKPVIASHSNSKEICDHRRNLNYAQIKLIKNVNGLIGINFCNEFLSRKKNPSFEDVLRHLEYFLSLSCENILALGSDFDGCKVPKEISGIEKINNLYEYLLKKNFKEDLLKKIFFENAYNFMKNFYT